MEAVSAGAARVKSSTVEGILSPLAFPLQGGEGNRYLTHRTYTNDLPQRVITFLSRCQAFIVLPGGLGTLTELCLTWDCSAITDLQPSHLQRPLCLLVQRQPWESVIQSVRQLIPISDQFMSHVTYVDSLTQTLQLLQQERSKFNTTVGQQQQQAQGEGQRSVGMDGKEEKR